MKLKGKRVAIFVENLYQEHEFWYPDYRMKEEGAEVIGVGPRKATYTSKHGYPVESDTPAEAIDAAGLDAVIIPGGYAPDQMRRHRSMVCFVHDMVKGGKVVAAICHAGWMLASAEALEGRTVTGFYAIKDDLVNAGATYVDEEVVRDGNLITSRKPDDLPAFCRTIIEALSEG